MRVRRTAARGGHNSSCAAAIASTSPTNPRAAAQSIIPTSTASSPADRRGDSAVDGTHQDRSARSRLHLAADQVAYAVAWQGRKAIPSSTSSMRRRSSRCSPRPTGPNSTCARPARPCSIASAPRSSSRTRKAGRWVGSSPTHGRSSSKAIIAVEPALSPTVKIDQLRAARSTASR